MKLFLRGLEGVTACLNLTAGAGVAEVRAAVQEHLGIPATELVLVVGGRPLCACGASLPDGATLHAHLRLAGGKGGFGALLRGQGRDGKVTTNFDACRDLSGRRIRAVEAEQKLKQWEADAPGRDLEALAMKHMRELAKEARAQKREEAVNVAEVRRQHQQAAEAVATAVQVALAAGLQQGSAAARRPSAAAAAPERAGSSGGSSSTEHSRGSASADDASNDGGGATVAAALAAGSKRGVADVAARPPAAAAAPAAKKRRTMLDLVEGSDGSDSDSDQEGKA